MANAAYSLTNRIDRNVEENRTESFIIHSTNGISRMEKLGESVFFPKKHVLLEAGNKTRYCYVVKTGRVISYEMMPDGEERIYHFYEKDSLFLEGEALFGKTSTVSFKTACATELIRINKTVLANAVQEDPQLALDIIESTSTKFQSSMEQVRHVRNYNIPWKICDVLLSLADYCGVSFGEKIVIQEKISQQTISSILGVNRITTVRAIKELKNRGLVEQIGGRYHINSISGLKDYQQSLDKYA